MRLILVSACFMRGALSGEPDVPPSNSNPFMAISSKVSALEARLLTLEGENKKELATHQAHYEQVLHGKRATNVKLALQNERIVKETQDWTAKNQELRAHAQMLQGDVELWQQDWDQLRANMTSAMEITNQTLSTLDHSKAPELQILRDMEVEDARRNAALMHDQRLNAILGAGGDGLERAAFVQTSRATTQKRQPPRSIVSELEDGLDALGKEHETREGELLQRYAKLIHAEDQTRDALLDEQRRLNTTRKAAEDLHSRLVLADSHLMQLSQNMTESGRAVRAFMVSLGSKPAPTEKHILDAPGAASPTGSAAQSAFFLGDEELVGKDHRSSALLATPAVVRKPRQPAGASGVGMKQEEAAASKLRKKTHQNQQTKTAVAETPTRRSSWMAWFGR